jgi:hypothetical protein
MLAQKRSFFSPSDGTGRVVVRPPPPTTHQTIHFRQELSNISINFKTSRVSSICYCIVETGYFRDEERVPRIRGGFLFFLAQS